MEAYGAQAARPGVEVELSQGGFIRDGEQHQGVGGRVPVLDDIRLVNREIKGRVRQLTRLCRRRQIRSSDQIQARAEALAVWHVHECTCAHKSRKRRCPGGCWDRTLVGMFGTVTFSPAVVSPLAVAVCPLVLTTGLDS